MRAYVLSGRRCASAIVVHVYNTAMKLMRACLTERSRLGMRQAERPCEGEASGNHALSESNKASVINL